MDFGALMAMLNGQQAPVDLGGSAPMAQMQGGLNSSMVNSLPQASPNAGGSSTLASIGQSLAGKGEDDPYTRPMQPMTPDQHRSAFFMNFLPQLMQSIGPAQHAGAARGRSVNLLGLLGVQQPTPATPDAMAGYQPSMPTMDPINQSLAANAPKPAPQESHGLFHQGGTISNILGAIGDAFLVQGGAAPVYGPMRQQKQMGKALANYLGSLDSGLADLLNGGMDAGDAVAAYKIKHGTTEQPAIAKEADYYRSIGRSDLADELLQRHAEGGPLIANNGDGTFTIVPQALVHGQQPPQAGGTPTAGAIEDGYRFKGGDPSKQENWEPVQGGATASTPSHDFR